MEILNKVIRWAIAPTLSFLWNRATYLFKIHDNVKALEDRTKDLLAKSSDVQEKINADETMGMVAKCEAQRWLKKVDDIEAKMKAIKEEYDPRRCSPNCVLNYNISKNAAKKLIEVQKLYEGAPKLEDVTMKPPPPHVQEMPIASSVSSSSIDINLQMVRKWIKDDPVGAMGIWGLGGIGKTHLLKQINNSFSGDSCFDFVIFVTASKDCSVAKIQAEIVKKLKLAADDDVKSQADIIFNFLSKKSFLLLLDDVWEQLNLVAVGIPSPLGIGAQLKRKMVLTTRSEAVCGWMDARKKLKVVGLKKEEAWCLFQEKVGEETIYSNRRITDLAKDVAKELQGLPLALITIGRAMHTKKDPNEWEDAISVLQSSRLDEIEEIVFQKLKLSYDCLKSDTLRQCFLTCSLWPEDRNISKEDLIQCWMGLGLIREYNDIRSAYNRGFTLIGELLAACLLESANDDDAVKMHDVLRDMALWISCDSGKSKNKWVVHAGVGKDPAEKDIDWSKTEYVSLMGNYLEVLPSLNGSSFLQLKTLLLQYNGLSEYTVGSIQTFSTLTYLDLSSNRLTIFPIELCTLANLEYLSLSGNYIEELPVHLRDLTKLKFLYLQNNDISRIAKGVISELEALQVLDLSSMREPSSEDLSSMREPSSEDYMPSLLEELSTLTMLKAVGIDVCSVHVLELLSQYSGSLPIRSLQLEDTPASFWLPAGALCNVGIRTTLSYLRIEYSMVERIIIGSNSEDESCHLDVLNELHLYSLTNLREIIWNGGVGLESPFPRLTVLTLLNCNMLEHLSWAAYLPCLRRLTVYLCESMKQIILSAENHDAKVDHDAKVVDRGEESQGTPLPTLPCLKFLFLIRLPELVSICNPSVSFPLLEGLVLEDCPNLKSLPFQRLITIPEKLRNIICSGWEQLEWEEEEVKSALQPLLNAHLD